MEFQLKDLLNWSQNKNINPISKRKIKTNGKIYLKLKKYHELLENNTHGIFSTGPKNEDRVVFQKGRNIFAGVYDGHGGKLTSNFIKQNIVNIYSNIQTNSITERLALTYKKLESDLYNYYKSIQGKDMSGSTACSVMVTPTTIYVANTGDSRCILSKEGKAIALTIDHKPNNSVEYKRIQDNNEKNAVSYTGVYRIGGLAVSRVFGDFYIKDRYKSVIYNPDIFVAKRNEYQDFLVIASDGLYDVMSNQEIVNFIHEQFKTTFNLNTVAKKLVYYSIYTKNTMDDVSVIIILL